MSDDLIKIEVDGKSVSAKKGQMIIEATDDHGAYVPRFCYHSKLSVAANCRMCLVEVEKAPKPLPACATPISEGMKIFTRSPYAIAAQKATMEFLLINHPLDCPICDQGGECELQDLAMGYGRGISRYNDNKRVVKDKNIGPLVSTDMTRCIHCTRCVRFGEEITGLQELGTLQRGENMKIDTYVEKSIDHELSSNIIDLCPVGALNNKPYRYSARSWEMVQHETIAPHDCVGSNLYAHVLRGKIKRIVPRENEQINEAWISDRDRFSYEGIYSDNRLTKPKIKKNGRWSDISWEKGLNLVAEKLKAMDSQSISILASPSSTLEEFYLLSRICEQLGINNVDHRLRRTDFNDQENDPLVPWAGKSLTEIENCDQLIVIGSDVRKEVPIIGHRIRKSALKGAKVSFINEEIGDYFFDIANYLPGDMIANLLAVIVALKIKLPSSIQEAANAISHKQKHKNLADLLSQKGEKLILLGHIAINHPSASALRYLASIIAKAIDADIGFITEGANSAGAYMTGILPHREIGGSGKDSTGKNTQEIIEDDSGAMVLWNAEPLSDIPDFGIKKSKNRSIIAFTSFVTPEYKSFADIMLPIGTFAETSGTFINCEGRWQSFLGVANPLHQARPGWKVLRVLGNLLNIDHFDYETSQAILSEIQKKLKEMPLKNNSEQFSIKNNFKLTKSPKGSIKAVPMYKIDSILRHSSSLQLTPEAKRSESL
tara:strand:+ start:196 stop:2343 length:2148 start_codon:yes stop_codon:yes gene_type:complete